MSSGAMAGDIGRDTPEGPADLCLPSIDRRMKRKTLLLAMLISLLSGCSSKKLLEADVAALYSDVQAEGFLVPITYDYAIVDKVDGRRVPYDENPVMLTQGMHRIEIRHGHCFAPVLIILCEFQPSTTKVIEQYFAGGRDYRVTVSGAEIVEK